MKNRFYLACFRDNVGGNIAFHGIKGNGYVTDLDKAEVLTREEAQRRWHSGRSYDQPISADHLDALAINKVDCQVLPYETQYDHGVTEWVAFRSGTWSGNDVYWRTASGKSLDVEQAVTLSLDEVKIDDPAWIYVPKSLAMAKKRRTVDMRHFNPRTMVQGAGLRMSDDMKRDRRRKDNPKSRMNCPACGKLHWQHNPYDFDGCNDPDCKEHKRY